MITRKAIDAYAYAYYNDGSNNKLKHVHIIYPGCLDLQLFSN